MLDVGFSEPHRIDGTETSDRFVVGPGQRFRMRWDAASYTVIVQIKRDELESIAERRTSAGRICGCRKLGFAYSEP